MVARATRLGRKGFLEFRENSHGDEKSSEEIC
jgi:hypothetical protein